MSRKTAIDSLFLKRPEPAASQSPEKASTRVRSGAVASMGAALQDMADGAKSAARLQEQLALGDRVVDLDPAVIDGSMIADRMSGEGDPALDSLTRSVAEHGQQVPVLVRPHPERAGRFQIVYGRRRLQAAMALGRSVRAVVKALTDEELVIAQGRENLDRADLSFIEIAFFARRLEDAKYARATIVAALSSDKADVSRYIAVARMIPEPLALKIGPARKAGRARWTELAEGLQRPKIRDRIEAATATPEFLRCDSDARFAQVHRIAAEAPTKPRPRVEAWRTPGGEAAAKVEQGPSQTKLVFDEQRVPAFGAFVAGQLDELYKRFTLSRSSDVERKA